MRAVTFGELLLRLSPPGDERLLESPELHTRSEEHTSELRHLGISYAVFCLKKKKKKKNQLMRNHTWPRIVWTKIAHTMQKKFNTKSSLASRAIDMISIHTMFAIQPSTCYTLV